MYDGKLEDSPLGKRITVPSEYDSSILFPIPRQAVRDENNIPTPLPFTGFDIWNGYEVSWLDTKGKPQIALAEFWIPCDTPNIIESKSLKLYLKSLNLSSFQSVEELKMVLLQDLSEAAGAPININLVLSENFGSVKTCLPEGICLDNLDIEVDTYHLNPDLLSSHGDSVEEKLYSYLLKSNCPCTGQPDWATLSIAYQGPQIDHKGLLKYIISYRNHNDFHEQCIETIFMDISNRCKPEILSVYGRYTRRGGLDINPFRTNTSHIPLNIRHHCQ